MSDFYEAIERKARKRHVCDICYREIPIGELHVYTSQVYDGMWSHERLHLACCEIADSIYDPYGECAFGEVLAWAEDDIEDVDGRWQLKRRGE